MSTNIFLLHKMTINLLIYKIGVPVHLNLRVYCKKSILYFILCHVIL